MLYTFPLDHLQDTNNNNISMAYHFWGCLKTISYFLGTVLLDLYQLAEVPSKKIIHCTFSPPSPSATKAEPRYVVIYATTGSSRTRYDFFCQ